MGLLDRFKNKSIIQKHSTAIAGTSPKYRKQKLSDKAFSAWKASSTASVTLDSSILNDRARFMKSFFAMVTRYVPAAKSAVWTWRNLSFTHSDVKLQGGTPEQRKQAHEELEILSERIFPIKSSQANGFDKLLNSWFTSTFRYGRFAGRIILTENMDGIQQFEIMDPFSIFFKKDTFQPFVSTSGSMGIPLNPLSFYYYGLDSDIDNPYGIALVESATTLIEVANEMIEDMRYSSSNAGIPRLHIKIKQPQILPTEDDEKYATRIKDYFSNTISEMDELAPDDNVYTWSDVEIATVGGQSASNFVWKVNLQIIQEEIISAFHLYPWIFGKSFGTTKNWVAAQYDVLMQMVTALHNEAGSFSDWIANTHLALAGLPMVKATRAFTSPRDPAAKDMAVAEQIRLANTKTKIEMGFIDKIAGAREHGYEI